MNGYCLIECFLQSYYGIYIEKVYIGPTEGTFKKRCYNHKDFFKLERYRNSTKLPSYICKVNEKITKVPLCNRKKQRNNCLFNIGYKMCKLSQVEKLVIIFYSEKYKLLNELSGTMTCYEPGQEYSFKTSFFPPLLLSFTTLPVT